MGDILNKLTVEKYDIIRKSRKFLKKFGYDIFMDPDDGLVVELNDGSYFPILKRNGVINLMINNILEPAELYYAKIYFQPCRFRLGRSNWFAIPKSDGYYPYDEYLIADYYMVDEFGNGGEGIINFIYTGGEIDDLHILQRYYSKLKDKK